MKLFTAVWCTNCAPVKKYVSDYMLDIEIIDIGKSPDLAKEYGVRSLPTLVVEGNTIVGAASILEYLKGGK